MAQKPNTPKGTRDFNPIQVAQRDYIINTIRNVFEVFGFQPIETPSFENLSTLMGKYGEEGDRLVFKILNSGDYLSKVKDETYQKKETNLLTPNISEKGLRYDLTVPFARYVVQHQNTINFPFKRYQIQPVWRADRPQKGRFREFHQCDADVVGSKSLWQEVECIQMYDTVFGVLKLSDIEIKINHRKILSGIVEVIGVSDKLIDFTVALDKLDKIGEDKVKEEMIARGIPESAIHHVSPLFQLSGSFETQIQILKDVLETSETGKQGIEELLFINQMTSQLGLSASILKLDVTLARGLDYYTGAIFEVAAPKEIKLGSIGGGGRYDNLTHNFGLKDVSGIGISFGLDRIYLVLEALDIFPDTLRQDVKILFVNLGKEEALFSLKAIKRLREQGVHCELYPDALKMKKQMQYANKRQIPYVIIVGEEEIQNNVYTLKDMREGKQYKLSLDDIFSKIN